MYLREWDDLPDFMKVEAVRPYWNVLNKRKGQLLLKRIFDFFVAFVFLIILLFPMGIIALAIKLDSKGPVFYR